MDFKLKESDTIMSINAIKAFVMVRFFDEDTNEERFFIDALYNDHGYCDSFGFLRASTVSGISDDFSSVSIKLGLWSEDGYRLDSRYAILYRGSSLRVAYWFFKSAVQDCR